MNNNSSTSNGKKKLLMSISGFLLICFLIFHLYFNISVLFGEDTYNRIYSYAARPALQVVASLLGMGFIFHILSAFFIAARQHYSRSYKKENSKHSFFSMLILGCIVLGFGGMHLTHFWYKTKLQHLLGSSLQETPYYLISDLFRQPLYVIMYLIWLIAIWLHLHSGLWNIFDAVSSKNEIHSIYIRYLKWLFIGASFIIVIGFAIIPLWFCLNLDK